METLKPNDHVALVCTGSICRHPSHPQIAQDYLKEHYQLYSTFDDDTTQSLPPHRRAEIFLKYLFDDNIRLITALRGGEGTADILPYIHQHHDRIKSLRPKVLLGYSDFTALLVYFSKYYRWPVIHGPSPLQFALDSIDKGSRQSTIDLLFKNQLTSGLDLTPLNESARQNQIIEAELTGGNVSIIQISIKDIWEIETKNKIVFLEDCSEKAHKIIRTLKYFSRIGLFDQIKAVIFGDFTCWAIGCEQKEQTENQQAILKTLSSFGEHHDFPVLYSSQFGHGKTNYPLCYSKIYRLQLGDNAQLDLR
ncbi:MAG: LD-carboxypeptidase [Candidatus Berkiellales bacterium]